MRGVIKLFYGVYLLIICMLYPFYRVGVLLSSNNGGRINDSNSNSSTQQT